MRRALRYAKSKFIVEHFDDDPLVLVALWLLVVYVIALIERWLSLI